MKGEQDMERQTPKNENTEFKDLPDVKIDPEKEVPSQKHFSKKTGIIIGLFLVLIVLFGAGYFMLQSRQQPAKPQEKETQEETKKEDEDTNQKYFNRNQKIKLTFTSTNVTKFIPEKAMVNGKSYDLQALGDNQYETLIDGFGDAGVKDITIEKFWMNNTKELEIKENNHAQVEILN